MQPLDRLFATLNYPWDALLPSAVWLALCAAALAGMAALLRWRGHPAPYRVLRPALWLGLGDMAVWLTIFVVRTLNEGDTPMWFIPVEAPYAAARETMDALLWSLVGVSAAVDPDQMFRGFMHWDGTLPVLAAALLNEAAFIAFAAGAVICANWRRPPEFTRV